MHPDRLLEDLTEAQRAAVTHTDGPLLVLAGAGSGKTRVITRRAGYLAATVTEPRHVVAITFTNKAANEMRERVRALGLAGVTVATFHALCARLLRRFASGVGLKSNFSIYDESDRDEVVRKAIRACELSPTDWTPQRVLHGISLGKNSMMTPEEWAARNAGDFAALTVARIWTKYEELMQERNALDFDDLLVRMARALGEDGPLRDTLEDHYRYVLIDEYQDTNLAQFEIARRLCLRRRNICATGDPDQSIYAWRGATISNILEFEQHFADAKVVVLEQNYRSTRRILAAASHLIAANQIRKKKTLWTENPEGVSVRAVECEDAESEAEHVAAEIARMAAAGRPLRDFAVFCRINAMTRVLEAALRDRAVPYQIARGVQFYARKEIRDVLAYLRVLVNPADEGSLLRIVNTPTRGIGETTVERVEQHARRTGQPLLEAMRRAGRIESLGRTAGKVEKFAELIDQLRQRAEGPVHAVVERVIERTGLQRELEAAGTDGNDRMANIAELISAAAKYDEEAETPALVDYLSQVALVSDTDALKDTTGCVTLMTLHAAKGLEFPVVFLVGLEEGLLPHSRALDDPEQMEEERRLCFVGMTRAKEQLVLTRSRLRQVRGTWLPTVLSPFLLELPAGEIEWFSEEGGQIRESRSPRLEPLMRLGGADRPRERRRFNTDGDNVRRTDSWPGRRARGAASGGWSSTAAAGAHGIHEGQLVTHARYGIGRVISVDGSGEQAKASVQFNSSGRRTFYLKYGTIRPVR